MRLSIDTSDNKKVTVSLGIGKKKDVLTRATDRTKAQAVLPMLEELLHKHNKQVTDISSIHVVEGPGSFTGLRVGIAIANTLGYLLTIPVNNKPVGTFAKAIYS